jgi:hypothetical protein
MKATYITYMLLAGLALTISCTKTGSTKTIVTAQTEAKVPMQNVKIVIHAQSSQGTPANGNLTDSAWTNSKGQVEFDFSNIYKDGQAGVAVLDLKGELISGADTLEGFSYVQLEAGVTKPATVVMRKKTK